MAISDEKREYPKYSVLMSVYKNDKLEYLKKAIDSMLNQTVIPEQYVVVIDGPVNKEIVELLNVYNRKSPELFTILYCEENKGLASALNYGLKYCRNQLVARMDADDISKPDRCEIILDRFMQNPKLTVCGCNIDEFTDDETDVKLSRIVPEQYEDIVTFFRKRQPFNHPTVIYKRDAVLEVGGYSNLRRKEDFDMFSKMLAAGNYAENVSQSLYLYRANLNNYKRRKSWLNCKSAIEVYFRHLKRHECTWCDFFVISCAEIIMWILPYKLMKIVSDQALRKKR